MDDDTLHAMRFGAADPPVRSRRLVAGNLVMLIEGGALRDLRWRGTEILRALDFLARDATWGTYVPEESREEVSTQTDGFRYIHAFRLGAGALDCRIVIEGYADGRLIATGRATASRVFETNRTGFVLLHPIHEAWRATVAVAHTDGSTEKTGFPKLISSSQPVFDIAGLSYCQTNISVKITFDGDVFEMEDHRNWTDASFKTYSRPLGLPAPYIVEAGAAVMQTIEVFVADLADRNSAAIVDASASGLRIGVPTGAALPEIALAVEDGWLGEGVDLVARSGVRALQIRIASDQDLGLLKRARPLVDALDAKVELEVIIPDSADPEFELVRVADACRDSGMRPGRVFALPGGYTKSHQPDGQWPTGVDVDEACRAARAAFPDALIGGGMLTNFTEFNRKYPPFEDCDYAGHGTMAIVHAADDRSVMQTLEALPDVFRSTRAIIGDRPYRLGLVSIGMRSNPYGASPARNESQGRLPMALYDPRQRGLFGAAWALGAVAATGGFGIESIALAAPFGPFGLAYRPEPVPQKIYDDDPEAVVFPLYHVVRSLASYAGAPLLAVDGVPRGVAAMAAAVAGRIVLWLANTGPESQEIDLGHVWDMRVLEPATFMAAAHDRDWLTSSDADRRKTLVLEPYAVAFVDAGGVES